MLGATAIRNMSGVVVPVVRRISSIAFQSGPALSAILAVINEVVSVTNANGNGAAFSWIGCGSHSIAVDSKVCDICTRVSCTHGETIGGVRAHHGTVLRPVGEGVARVGSGCQRDAAADVVSARTRDTTSIRRIGTDGDADRLGGNRLLGDDELVLH